MKVLIENKSQKSDLNIKLLEELFLKIKDKNTMAIIFINSDDIRELNKTYRGIDKVTDVLSFSTEDLITNDLGDIFICSDILESQAEENGNSTDYEMCFLAVHGYLHLKGYDHETEEDYKHMMDLTSKILQKVFKE